MGPTSPQPTLEEMLADPIVQLLMVSDNVVADDIRRIVHAAQGAHRSRDLLVERRIGLVHDTLNDSASVPSPRI